MPQLAVFLTAVAGTFALQLSGFAVAFALQTETFYDVLGGLNYIALAVLSAASGQLDLRKVLFTVVFVCSRSWLLIFLAWRAHERKGDARFDGVKDKFGQFLLFWVVQGVWVLLVSMPALFVNSAPAGVAEFAPFDWVMIVGFAAGVVIEAAADTQKAIWVKRGRPGGFCQVGVWQCSRHPNYFGEILQWWCAWAYAYSSSQRGGFTDPLWWACAVSPLFTMHVLLNLDPTGVPNAEGKNLKRYYDTWPEEYAAYRENTSVLIPMIGYKHVPLLLKRTVFLDFARFEYRPRQPPGKLDHDEDEGGEGGYCGGTSDFGGG